MTESVNSSSSGTTNIRKFEQVCNIIETYQYNPNKLIPILQMVQEEYRYLPQEIMTFVASSLDISPAKVYGVDDPTVYVYENDLISGLREQGPNKSATDTARAIH